MHARPVLLAESEPRIGVLAQEALRMVGGNHLLMVVSDAAEVRHYLAAATRANRLPLAILLDAGSPPAISLLSWMADPENAVPPIPVITLGARPSPPHFYEVEAAAKPLTAVVLADVLRSVLFRDAAPHAVPPAGLI